MNIKKDNILIVGAGNMGLAFLSALLDNKVNPKQIFILENNPIQKLKKINKTRKFNLINSISLNNTVDRIKVEESKDSKSGIVTTAEELKCFSIVKTIIAMSSKIKNTDLDRVGYRDYKGFFNIIVDDKARNTICYFKLNDNKKLMGIEGEEYDIGNVSVKSITKFRRQLTDSALLSLTN